MKNNKRVFYIFQCFMILTGMSTFSFAEKGQTAQHQFNEEKQQLIQLSQSMKQNYQLLRMHLTGNQQNQLKYSQIAWMRQRDAQCDRDPTLRLQCHLDVLVQRNQWLRNQISMCKAHNCQTIAMDR